ncbi:hypothetical protein HG536_0B01120 [Torulaspora globosa]|uniref:DNA polymerase epsilon catalytic subunit n=1 Tax=Torulaspora globosa TaxID=48254 RepID=A0A7G3ZCL5_9SACH|nr:uncharacterized protein HG536_0B01120 [Torulaspora globosa]QLL31251.1 hypothetical protein HG536_0B01120 [Torulaspora globosa]
MSSWSKGSNTARVVKNGWSNGVNSTANSLAVTANQMMQAGKIDEIDSMMGFERYFPPQYTGRRDPGKLDQVPGRVGWLTNMHATLLSPVSMPGASASEPLGIAGVDFYFLDEEGGSFKSSITYDPYFFIKCSDVSRANDVEEFIKKYLDSCLKGVSVVEKEDLSLDNHLMGLKSTLIKLTFINSNKLFEARKLLRPILTFNENNNAQKQLYSAQGAGNSLKDAKSLIEDIREYDVPYHVRVSIDKNIRVGKWYKITSDGLHEITEKVAFADPVVLAFDIETTKAPLKFPDSAVDQIMMISYMIDGDGFLITNREIISEDIEDFEYSPKPEYPGLFTIFNESDELALLQRFFEHIRDVRPTVIATFNGDFFDWPFIDNRSKIHGLDMFEEIGFSPDSDGEYKSSYCSHMDCFRWVKRDSYLPQGSQGLKAVTQVKLGYNPIELDPELMTPYAFEKPQQLSEYSVSDAVATYYLYMKYVHPFIFSLCTIIPLNPDEVLRKGTGTLCEMLLMVQAYNGNIILPNKYTDPVERFYDGHLLESETYVGGHVESLEAGVFRSDIATDFQIDADAIDELLSDLPHALRFCIEVENKSKLEDVTNFQEIKEVITSQLLDLKLNSKRCELPLIYHVDVASMYPNIMTTNRLQPDSMKTERDCASCDFNRPGKLCDRRLKWSWRGEFFPAKMDEYNMVKRALQNETFLNKRKFSKKKYLTFDELSYAEQVSHIKKRLTDYSRKVYHRVKVSEVVERESIVCQRENPFYVNTVRSFRDRRYEFKGLAKTWKGKLSSIPSADKHAKDEARKMIVLYDSLQLAHKVILNSFYGYVMRKGSRWYSMEMAGITCLTGATIIQMARALVERLGRPLELDTDGIWCILPKSFPENFSFTLKNGKRLFLSYPCSMLNYRVHQKFTNTQYQEIIDPVKHKYQTHSENSIFFEVDGPYRAMILPTSKEEGKGIKKRYAVFNEDGSLAELKGFELKRRGELQLIKNFQGDLFKVFLQGDNLQGCYSAVADVANRWLDILDSRGSMLEDEDLIELICENRSMSKTLKEYEGQKSTSITTAKRLGEFLGEDMVKDKGLQCKYIISSLPAGSPVTERAIPVAIFSADITVKRSFLRRWTLDSSLEDFDPRTIIDWLYYRERIASVIQKIITIPAALQNISNPVPRVEHPPWLKKRLAIKDDKFKQGSLNRFLTKALKPHVSGQVQDIEDLFDDKSQPQLRTLKTAKVSVSDKRSKRKRSQKNEEEALVLPSTMPSLDEDYVTWLQYQKIKWKIQRRDRMRRTQLFGDMNSSAGRSALGGMMRKQAETYANSTWEILQYKPSTQPGILNVFVSIQGQVQILKFRIPKTIYVNFKSIPNLTLEHLVMEPCNATIPNSSRLMQGTCNNLYKCTMPESVYYDAVQKESNPFTDANVIAVFESTIRATERAILELGSSVIFRSNVMGSLGKGLQNGFEMKNLSMSDTQRYLSRFSLPVVYLLHIHSSIGYEFFCLVKSWSKIITLHVLKPSSTANELSLGLMQQIYAEAYQHKKSYVDKFSRFMALDENMTFEVQSFDDLSKLHNKLSSNVSKLKEEKGLQFLLILHSPYPLKLRKKIKLLDQVPVLQLSMNEMNLPQLQWQPILAKKMVSHFLSCGAWLSHLVTISQFSSIPLCNLKLDNAGYVIDILYARQLKQDGFILWWNENDPLPDHGGVQKDFDLNTLSLMTDVAFQNVNIPSIFDHVVLEVGVGNLTVNAVLASALINEAEGGESMGTDGASFSNGADRSTSEPFVKDAFSVGSLMILRNLLKEWWDGALTGNTTSDLLINSFVTWIQNPDSKLFDASLRYHIHNLTKKSLLQLMSEFQNLGSNVTYADRNKILVKTPKLTPETCYAYGQYIVKAVRKNLVFTYLDLRIEKYWDLLIWMDKHNFGGLACAQIQEKETQDIRAFSKWQMKDFLPPIYQSEFDDWMMIILDSLAKTKKSYLEANNSTQRPTQILSGKVKKIDMDEDEGDGPLAGFTSFFFEPLLNRVQKLYRNEKAFILDPKYAAEYAFPFLPGSFIKMKAPLLELVKYLCHLMSLSKANILEVRQLRKELLKIFEVREFDKRAEFRNPSASLLINGFLCESCFYTIDIDFCRDNPSTLFKCPNCHKELNRVLLQEHLIQSIYVEVESYLTQDLKCSRCHKVKQDNMSEYCACSGSWVGSISKDMLIDKILVFQQVSEYYSLDLVLSALADISM